MRSDFSLKILGKSDISKERKIEKAKTIYDLGNYYLWLSGRMHIEERLNEGPRLQSKHKDENETKTNEGLDAFNFFFKTSVTPDKDNMTSCKPNAWRIQVRATCG